MAAQSYMQTQSFIQQLAQQQAVRQGTGQIYADYMKAAGSARTKADVSAASESALARLTQFGPEAVQAYGAPIQRHAQSLLQTGFQEFDKPEPIEGVDHVMGIHRYQSSPSGQVTDLGIKSLHNLPTSPKKSEWDTLLDAAGGDPIKAIGLRHRGTLQGQDEHDEKKLRVKYATERGQYLSMLQSLGGEQGVAAIEQDISKFLKAHPDGSSAFSVTVDPQTQQAVLTSFGKNPNEAARFIEYNKLAKMRAQMEGTEGGLGEYGLKVSREGNIVSAGEWGKQREREVQVIKKVKDKAAEQGFDTSSATDEQILDWAKKNGIQ